ncbi:MAG: S8 family serine peptidase [Rickettsiales bacterium]|nr:S8 family serine peptidase [Rickettsiales bacterium]
MTARPSPYKLIPYSLMIAAQLLSSTSALAAETPYIVSPKPISSLTLEDQQAMFNAVDRGDVERLRAHVNFVRSMLQSAPGATPSYRVNLDFRDIEGNTPLIRAARAGNMDMVKFLVENGANINAQNNRWETALISSYNAGKFDVAKYLIAQNAADPYNAAQLIKNHEALSTREISVAKTGMGAGSGVVLGGAVLAGAVAAAVGLGGGGSGGGGGGGGGITGSETIDCGAGAGIHPEACSAASFDTAESQNQEGILDMRANYAYAHGYDGRIFNRDGSGNLLDDQPDGHVIVAVVDTGVDMTHSELDANSLVSLSVTCDDSGCATGGSDTDEHGTWVAGIIAAERNESSDGMHGVAPEANIMSIGFADDNGDLTNGDAPGILYATNNGAQVINASYGLQQLDNSSLTIAEASVPQLQFILNTTYGGTTLASAYNTAIQNGTIIVYSAGNDGTTEPGVLAGMPLYFQGATAPAAVTQGNYDAVNPSHYDWSGHWVAAISLDDSGNISSFSEECGLARDWCLAAPGEITTSTQNGGGYSSAIQGTSFAAPNISGAIAIMLGAFPQLDPTEVLDILFDTADDLGVAGVDAVYGHGRVNLEAATDPTVGGWTLSVPGSHSSFGFSTSGFGLSAPFGDSLTKSTAHLIFTDAYRKDYTIGLGSVSRSLSQTKSAFTQLMQFAQPEFAQSGSIGNFAQVSFTSTASQQGQNTPFSSFSFSSALPNAGLGEQALSLNYHTHLASAVSDWDQERLVMSGATLNPYLSLTDVANSSVMEFKNPHSKTLLAAYDGKFRDEYDYQFATNKRIGGAYYEQSFSYDANQAEVAFSNGVVVENNSLLGSETSGAFGIDQSTTYHSGIAGRYALADDVTLLANYHMGLTQVAASHSSLFTDFGTIMTNAFAFGTEFNNVGRSGDRLGFMVSQPMRVMSGRAGLTLPVDVLKGGDVVYQNQSLNLTPTAQEWSFEGYYHLISADQSQLSLNSALRVNPNHDATAENDARVFLRYSLDF